MKNLRSAYQFLGLALLFFLAFAYNFEYNRDFFTWLWLFSAQFFFMQSLRNFIKYDRR